MCGRYASTRSAVDLVALFEALDETDGALSPDYNVAPTDPVPIVRHSVRTPSRVVSVGHWGLVPSWAADAAGAARMINARAETVATSRAFAQSFSQRRCLVPADGWYEWVARTGAAGARAGSRAAKQPYFMTRSDGGGLAFAGIWSPWGAGVGRRLTFSILTLPAEGGLAAVHHRMPLVLEPDRWEEWLRSADPTGLLVAAAPEYVAGIELRPVSAAVGDVRNDGPDLVREVTIKAIERFSMESQAPTLF